MKFAVTRYNVTQDIASMYKNEIEEIFDVLGNVPECLYPGQTELNCAISDEFTEPKYGGWKKYRQPGLEYDFFKNKVAIEAQFLTQKHVDFDVNKNLPRP